MSRPVTGNAMGAAISVKIPDGCRVKLEKEAAKRGLALSAHIRTILLAHVQGGV